MGAELSTITETPMDKVPEKSIRCHFDKLLEDFVEPHLKKTSENSVNYWDHNDKISGKTIRFLLREPAKSAIFTILDYLPFNMIMKTMRCVSKKWFELCFSLDFTELCLNSSRNFDSFLEKFIKKLASEHEHLYYRPLAKWVNLEGGGTYLETVNLIFVKERALTKHPSLSMIVVPPNYYKAIKRFEDVPCRSDYVLRNLAMTQVNSFQSLDTLILSNLLVPENLQHHLRNRQLRSLYLEHCSIEHKSNLDLTNITTLKEFTLEFRKPFRSEISLPSSVTKLKVINGCNPEREGPIIRGISCKQLNFVEIISPLSCLMNLYLSSLKLKFFQLCSSVDLPHPTSSSSPSYSEILSLLTYGRNQKLYFVCPSFSKVYSLVGQDRYSRVILRLSENELKPSSQDLEFTISGQMNSDKS